MKEKKSFFGKIKDILIIIGNILLIVLIFLFFAGITALTGKLVNYSPWSLLIFDTMFVLVVKKVIDKFYQEGRKINRFWTGTLSLFILLGIIISIGVSLVHAWAILNILVLIFLFFFSLIVFMMKRTKV